MGCGSIDAFGSNLYSSGALSVRKIGTGQAAISSVASPGDLAVSLNLQNGAAIFGNSEKVQPDAVRSLVLVRAY